MARKSYLRVWLQLSIVDGESCEESTEMVAEWNNRSLRSRKPIVPIPQIISGIACTIIEYWTKAKHLPPAEACGLLEESKLSVSGLSHMEGKP